MADSSSQTTITSPKLNTAASAASVVTSPSSSSSSTSSSSLSSSAAAASASSASSSSAAASSSSSSSPPLLSVLEFVVHLSDFKNLDLFRQGLYYVRTTIYTVTTDEFGKKNKDVHASPYHVITTPPPVNDDSCVFFPAFIDDTTHVFASRTFRVQFCEQLIDLNDICLYRLEVNARQRQAIHLCMELMFCDYSTQDMERGRDAPAPDTYEKVSTKTFTLNHTYTKGIHSFIPVTFDEAHFCLIQSMIHSMLMEFRFRIQDSTHQARVPEQQSHSVSSPSLHSRSHIADQPEQETHDQDSQQQEELGAYPPFALLLFPRLASSSVSASSPLYLESEICSLADRYHMFFLTNIIRAYNQLAITFETYLIQCLNGESREALTSKGIAIKPLTLPAACIRKSSNRQKQQTGKQAEQEQPLQGSDEQSQQRRKEDQEERKDAAQDKDRYLRPAAIITDTSSPNHQQERTNKTAPPSPASPSILPPSSPLIHTQGDQNNNTSNPSNQLVHAPIPSPPPSPAPNPSEPSPSSSSSEYDSMLAATQRYHARRRRSHDHRRQVDYSREREELRQQAALMEKYAPPILERLSVRLKRKQQLNYSMIARTILGDLLCVSQQCFHLWNIFLQLLPLLTNRLFPFSLHQWEQVCLDHWSAFVFRESYSIDHRYKISDESIMETHAEIATIARKNAAIILPLLPVIEVENITASNNDLANQQQQAQKDRGGVMGDHENQVVVFEEAYSRKHPNKDDNHSGESETQNGALDSNNMEEDGLSVSQVDVSVNQEISEVDIDHSALVSGQGVDSRALPAAIKEKQKNHEFDNDQTITAQTTQSSTATASSISSAALCAPPTKLINKSGKHLFILCHGYQGNSWDMRLFKNQLALLLPNAVLVLSSSNETQTEGDIAEMGERLAKEIHAAVIEHCVSVGVGLGQLSFVAHSLGGLIVRAALANSLCSQYLPYLHTFITLATPHLGYIYAENSWLTTGLWLLKKWNKSLCLSQLSLTDADQLEQCYLYKLSLSPVLTWFEHVFLLASQQDKYVPFHSARIEHCIDAEHDLKKGRLYHKMVNNLLHNMDHVSMKRFDLQFVNKKKNLDSLIGRAAHIFFLDQMGYMQLILNVYKQYLL